MDLRMQTVMLKFATNCGGLCSCSYDSGAGVVAEVVARSEQMGHVHLKRECVMVESNFVAEAVEAQVGRRSFEESQIATKALEGCALV